MVPLAIVHLRSIVCAFSHPSSVCNGVAGGTTSYAIVRAFAFRNKRLPIGIEGIDSEPASDGHTAAWEFEIVLAASGVLNKLI
jgi:hypothetical protein